MAKKNEMSPAFKRLLPDGQYLNTFSGGYIGDELFCRRNHNIIFICFYCGSNKREIDPMSNIFFILLAQCCFFVYQVEAKEIPKEIAIYCVIGEAENQGDDGMRAVAMALRNRGTTKGVYGCTSERVRNRKYSSKIFVRALMAWEETRGLNCTWADETVCADSWYSKEDVKKDPGIFDRCVFTGKLKDHYFFKCN
jgi:hypothetical protein